MLRFLSLVGLFFSLNIATSSASKSYRMANGDILPGIGLGTWKSAPNEVKSAVKEAIKVGYRHIDCAAIYGNEKEVGEALSECFKEGIVDRKDLWVTSKLWNANQAKEHVIPALKQTLSDLQLDYLDLYLIHWPVRVKHGVTFPESGDDMEPFNLEETWKAMEEARELGLARHIGVSNFSIEKLKKTLSIATYKPEVNQVERHPYLQQKALADFCRKNGIHITNYSSLGSRDRPNKPEGEPILLDDPTVMAIAEKQGASPAAVLLKWGLEEGASVIPKSVNPERLKQNLEINESVTLDSADMEKLRALDRHFRYVDGKFWCKEGSPYTIESLWDEPSTVSEEL